MILGERGQALIKSYEKLRLTAYLPTPNDVPTIGYGHTKGVRLGTTCTIEQAELWFTEDTAWAVRAVAAIPVRLTPSMADALISLVFNAGSGTVAPTSTIGKALRSPVPDYFAAWAGMALWRKQGGRDLLGLARRRAREMELFFEDGLPALDVGVIRA
jgi:lysozyme